MRMKLVVATAALILLLVTFATIIAVLATLPGHLDEFLLTDDDFCYSALENNGDNDITGTRKQPSIQIDYGDYKRKMMLDKTVDDKHQEEQPTKGQNHDRLQERVSRSVLRRMAMRLREQSIRDDDYSREAKACLIHGDDQQKIVKNQGQKEILWENSHEGYGVYTNNDQSRRMNPMCQGYRTLRTRLRFQQLLLSWNWHYRAYFRVKYLTLHSLADEVAFVSKKDTAQSPWWMFGWSLISREEDADAARVNIVPREKNYPAEQSAHSPDENAPYSASHLPPSLAIETVDISFQSWIRPVVSAHMQGITINVVLQKGGLHLPSLQMTASDLGKVANSSALLIGAMPIQEVLFLLPKPPEIEGLYPRIGFVNISNVMINVYENKAEKKAGSVPSLNLMLKLRIPDKFFLPITNLTLAHKQAGIDRKHFQPMMESSISNALRRHLLREATSALHTSWAHAHKAQEQLQHFVLRTQEVYLDRWIGTGVQAWHQTQENVWKGVVNGTAPLVRAMEDWVSDLKEIVSEPVPPLAVVVSHHWNRTLDGIKKYGVTSIDKQIWRSHLHELVAKSNHFKREKKISKHLGELKDAFDGFIAKSGQDMELLIKSCELEAKDIWLQWHRQFLPEL
ncbi:hypothetical protein ACHAXR_011925 [Thalassiosira sp. AJA248-18]